MRLEIFPNNIDDRILKRAADLLASGGLVVFPTDSSWSIACDVSSSAGVEKLKKLKGTKLFTPTVLTSELSQWADFADLSNAAFRFVKRHVPGPFVFVFPARQNRKNVFELKRLEVGLRMPHSPIPQALLKTLGRPLYAITASRELSEPGWWDEAYAQEYLFEAGWELEELPGIDLVLDDGELLPKNLTTVVDMSDAEPKILRPGIGDLIL